MADTLLQALQAGLSRPTDNGYGIGAQVVASTTPNLYNPYDSDSRNIATTVGAGLLGGLLTGMARREAQQENQQLMPLMGQIMNSSDPNERVALASGNPRLSPLVQALAMQDFERKNKVDTEVAKFNALSPLQRQQTVDNKLIDYGFEQGQIPTEDGLIGVDSIGLKDPIEFEVERQRRLAEGDQSFRKELLTQAESNGNVADLPQDLQRPAMEQRQTQESEAARASFIEKQFNRAKDIKSVEAVMPYSAGSKELEGIQESLKQSWQLVTGKEMSGVALEEFNALVPKASDTKAVIEMKKQRFIEMLEGASQGTPILESKLSGFSGGNTVTAPDGNTYVFTD